MLDVVVSALEDVEGRASTECLWHLSMTPKAFNISDVHSHKQLKSLTSLAALLATATSSEAKVERTITIISWSQVFSSWIEADSVQYSFPRPGPVKITTTSATTATVISRWTSACPAGWKEANKR